MSEDTNEQSSTSGESTPSGDDNTPENTGAASPTVEPVEEQPKSSSFLKSMKSLRKSVGEKLNMQKTLRDSIAQKDKQGKKDRKESNNPIRDQMERFEDSMKRIYVAADPLRNLLGSAMGNMAMAPVKLPYLAGKAALNKFRSKDGNEQDNNEVKDSECAVDESIEPTVDVDDANQGLELSDMSRTVEHGKHEEDVEDVEETGVDSRLSASVHLTSLNSTKKGGDISLSNAKEHVAPSKDDNESSLGEGLTDRDSEDDEDRDDMALGS